MTRVSFVAFLRGHCCGKLRHRHRAKTRTVGSFDLDIIQVAATVARISLRTPVVRGRLHSGVSYPYFNFERLSEVQSPSMSHALRSCLSAVLLAALAIPLLSSNRALAQQPAERQSAELTARPAGLRLFISTGCGACHRIAGTVAEGKVGPDLTHLASRNTIGANLLPTSSQNLFAWITRTQELKPGVRMPPFGMLPASETNAIVEYLMTLK